MMALLSAVARFLADRAARRGEEPTPEALAAANLGLAPEAYIIVDAYFGAYAQALPARPNVSPNWDASQI